MGRLSVPLKGVCLARLQDRTIIRNRLKLEAIVQNARAYLRMQATGLVIDHVTTCHCYEACRAEAEQFEPG